MYSCQGSECADSRRSVRPSPSKSATQFSPWVRLGWAMPTVSATSVAWRDGSRSSPSEPHEASTDTIIVATTAVNRVRLTPRCVFTHTSLPGEWLGRLGEVQRLATRRASPPRRRNPLWRPTPSVDQPILVWTSEIARCEAEGSPTEELGCLECFGTLPTKPRVLPVAHRVARISREVPPATACREG
jgi:hypothetical protein